MVQQQQLTAEEKSYSLQALIATDAMTAHPNWEEAYNDQEADADETDNQINSMKEVERKSTKFWLVFIACIAAASLLIFLTVYHQ